MGVFDGALDAEDGPPPVRVQRLPLPGETVAPAVVLPGETVAPTAVLPGLLPASGCVDYRSIDLADVSIPQAPRHTHTPAAHTSLFDRSGARSSPAFHMMLRMGYVPGGRLGIRANGLLEPLVAQTTHTRAGLGVPAPGVVLGYADDPYEAFQARAATTATERHHTTTVQRLQRTAARLSGDDARWHELRREDLTSAERYAAAVGLVCVMWRVCAVEAARSAPLLAEPRDPAVPGSVRGPVPNAVPDAELEQWSALPAHEQLVQLATRLREAFRYCFYCGVQYEHGDALAELCPGPAEEQHQ